MDEFENDLKAILDVSIQTIKDEQNFLSLVVSNTELGIQLQEQEIFKDNGALYKLIFSVYATYEYTVKECSLRTLEYLDDQHIGVEKLIDELQMLVFRQQLDDLRKKITEKRNDKTVIKPLTELHIKIKNSGKFLSKEQMIDTKSNLNYETLKEILEIFRIPEQTYKKYSIVISSLLTYRNKIAHGNRKELTSANIRQQISGNYQEITLFKEQNKLFFRDLCGDIIELIEQLAKDLIDFIKNDKYLSENQ